MHDFATNQELTISAGQATWSGSAEATHALLNRYFETVDGIVERRLQSTIHRLIQNDHRSCDISVTTTLQLATHHELRLA